jgi:peptidoglycan/LPS O-acetylase OafA/YrhL
VTSRGLRRRCSPPRAGALAYAVPGIAAIIALAWASYQLVEKRFLALKDRPALRREVPRPTTSAGEGPTGRSGGAYSDGSSR